MPSATDPELLRRVFCFHIVDRVVHADGRVDRGEIAWVRQRFPREQLDADGLIDAADRLTPRYRDLLAEALMRLPAELDVDAKLGLIDAFFGAALADGHFVVGEGSVIVVAARLLGLPLAQVHAWLDQDPRFGEVDLADPESP